MTPEEKAQYLAALLQSSLNAHQAGDFVRAEAGYREVLSNHPGHPSTLDLFGTLLFQTGRVGEALEPVEKAVELDPSMAGAWSHLGAIRTALNDIAGAVIAFERATDLDSQNLEIWLNLSRVAEQGGQIDVALRAARFAVDNFAETAPSLTRLGAAMLKAARADEAIDALKRALRISPGDIEARFHLAMAYKSRAEATEVQRELTRAILLAPSVPDLYPHLGSGSDERPSADGREWARRAVCLNPLDPRLWSKYATECELAKDDLGCIRAAKRALVLKPDDHAAHYSLGIPLFRVGQFAGSRAACRHALMLYPDMIELTLIAAECEFIFGDLATGWPLYEARVGSRIDSERFGLPPYWDKSSSPGRLLVAAEQGIGDEYAFLSLLPKLAETVPDITVECDKRNLALFARSLPGLKFVERQVVGRLDAAPYFDYRDLIAKQSFDHAILSGSLPSMFVDDPEVPGPLSVLVPDAGEREKWVSYFSSHGDAPIVGIVWRGGLSSKFRDQYYCDAEMMVRALGPGAATYVSLVYNLRSGELDPLKEIPGCTVLDPPGIDQKNELDRVAAMLSCLDAVVSVDTAVCTLAAALGVPTLRLHYGFLYLSDRQDPILGSCYPMVRNNEIFDMTTALDRAAERLPELLRSRR